MFFISSLIGAYTASVLADFVDTTDKRTAELMDRRAKAKGYDSAYDMAMEEMRKNMARFAFRVATKD